MKETIVDNYKKICMRNLIDFTKVAHCMAIQTKVETCILHKYMKETCDALKFLETKHQFNICIKGDQSVPLFVDCD